MSTKHTNPYRDGSSYCQIMEFIRKEQIVTRKQLIEKFPVADVTVVLTPRAKGNSRGDPRGSFSAKGHVYYMERLKKKTGEPQRFRLRWRKNVMKKRVRPPKKEIEAQKGQKKLVKAPKNQKKLVKA